MSREGSRAPPVCVLGMGRSGTSLTTRVIGLLGVQLGSSATMLRANPQDNPYGYWEQAAIRELNDDLLAALGGTWWQPPPLDDGWHRDARLDPLKQRARELVGRHFPAGSQWGWKDPRTTLTLPFWREIFGGMLHVVCIRNPADVAASLLRRDPVAHPRDETLALWFRYSGEALRNTAGEPRLFVSFEEWFEYPERQLERIAGFVTNGERSQPAGWQREALAFLDREARHHASPMTELETDASVPADVRLFHLTLLHLVTHRSGPELEAGLQLLTEWWETREHERSERAQLLSRMGVIQEELELHRNWLTSIQTSMSWRSTTFLRRLKRTALSLRRDPSDRQALG